jgi:hypothetical protein
MTGVIRVIAALANPFHRYTIRPVSVALFCHG